MYSHIISIFDTMKNVLLFLFLSVLLPLTVFAQHCETKALRNLGEGNVTQWETVEIGLRFPVSERLYRKFFVDHSEGINPFAQENIRMQFICHGKAYTVPAFYMEDATADEKKNCFVTEQAEWPWRVRFAVPDTGQWECLVLVGETRETSVPQPANIRFRCVPGNHHGYLQPAPGKPYFEYTDHTPFFAIGQNIAWADAPVLHGSPGPHPVYSAGYYDVLHYMDDLAANGGNYVRIVMINWSTGILWNDPDAYMQDHAWALDSMLRLAEARNLHVHLCFDLTTGFAKDNPPGTWSPIRNQYQKKDMTAADLLHDSTALAAFDRLIRYIHARWAFSPVVSTLELIGEQPRWEGFEGREQYFVDFYEHVNQLLRGELEDPWHMLSTSQGEHDPLLIFKSPALSFVDIHQYTNDFVMNQRRFKLVHKRSIEKIGKPFLFGEMGIINGPVNACDPDDWDYCNDITMHNSLWATTFMGTAGAGLYWWQWKNDAFREANFPALRWFIDSVAGGMSFYTQSELSTANGLETYYCRKEDKSEAVGWVHNTSYWWGNMNDSCRDRNGKQMIHPKDDDKATQPEKREGATFTLSGLSPGSLYTVKLYDTRNSNQVVASYSLKTNRFGKLKIVFPGGADYCFKALALPATE